jgi:hypothetical protein
MDRGAPLRVLFCSSPASLHAGSCTMLTTCMPFQNRLLTTDARDSLQVRAAVLSPTAYGTVPCSWPPGLSVAILSPRGATKRPPPSRLHPLRKIRIGAPSRTRKYPQPGASCSPGSLPCSVCGTAQTPGRAVCGPLPIFWEKRLCHDRSFTIIWRLL